MPKKKGQPQSKTAGKLFQGHKGPGIGFLKPDRPDLPDGDRDTVVAERRPRKADQYVRSPLPLPAASAGPDAEAVSAETPGEHMVDVQESALQRGARLAGQYPKVREWKPFNAVPQETDVDPGMGRADASVSAEPEGERLVGVVDLETGEITEILEQARPLTRRERLTAFAQAARGKAATGKAAAGRGVARARLKAADALDAGAAAAIDFHAGQKEGIVDAKARKREERRLANRTQAEALAENLQARAKGLRREPAAPDPGGAAKTRSAAHQLGQLLSGLGSKSGSTPPAKRGKARSGSTMPAKKGKAKIKVVRRP